MQAERVIAPGELASLGLSLKYRTEPATAGDSLDPFIMFAASERCWEMSWQKDCRLHSQARGTLGEVTPGSEASPGAIAIPPAYAGSVSV